MILVPAIDILGQKAVRLKEGDYDQITVYNDDVVAQAQSFEAAGAERIHIVDLDGARDGAPTNIKLICAIAAKTSVELEVGGGIRSMETVERYLDAGVTRLVFGSALVRDSAFCEQAVAAHPANIVAGIDARDGQVAIEGWREGTKIDATKLVSELTDRGIHELIYTDIARDGMQCGIDAAAYARLAQIAGFPITASGGISSLDDIRSLAALAARSIDGIITGRAIYEHAFSVEEGVQLCKDLSV